MLDLFEGKVSLTEILTLDMSIIHQLSDSKRKIIEDRLKKENPRAFAKIPKDLDNEKMEDMSIFNKEQK